MTKRSAVTIVALVLTLCMLLTGCGPVNAGAAAVSDFRKYMDGRPGVSDVQVSASNDLPFVGSASANVIILAGASNTVLTDVVKQMATYLRRHADQVSWSMSAELDGFTLGVSGVDADNAATIALLGHARAVPSVVGGTVGVADQNSFIVADPLQFIDALGQLVQLDFAGPVRVQDVDESFVVTSSDTLALPAGAIAAYEAVAAEFGVTSAQLEPAIVALRVAADGAVPAATALARSLPGSSGITFTITGGIVTRQGEGDFALVDRVIARALDLPGVSAINANPDVLAFTVQDTDTVVALEALIAELDPQSTVTVNYRSAEGVPSGFRLYGRADRRATYLPIVTELRAVGYIYSIEVDADRIDVVAGTYSESQMANLAADLKRLVPGGEQVRLTNVKGGVNFSFRASEFIDVPNEESYGDVPATDFMDAWNNAP